MVTSCIAHAAPRQLTAASCGFLSAAVREGQHTVSETAGETNVARLRQESKQSLVWLTEQQQ